MPEKTQQQVLQEIADAHRASQQDAVEQHEPVTEEPTQDEPVQQPADAVITTTGTAKRGKTTTTSDVVF